MGKQFQDLWAGGQAWVSVAGQHVLAGSTAPPHGVLSPHPWLDWPPRWPLPTLCVDFTLCRKLSLPTALEEGSSPPSWTDEGSEEDTWQRCCGRTKPLSQFLGPPHPEPCVVVPQGPSLGRRGQSWPSARQRRTESRLPGSLVWEFQGPHGPPLPEAPELRAWRC